MSFIDVEDMYRKQMSEATFSWQPSEEIKKKMNPHKKGMNAEAIARKDLRNAGYTVDFKTWSKFGSKDLFGLFDLVAIKSEILKFVQIKTNHKNVSKAKKDILEFCNTYGLRYAIDNCMDIEVWERTEDKEWIVYSLELLDRDLVWQVCENYKP